MSGEGHIDFEAEAFATILLLEKAASSEESIPRKGLQLEKMQLIILDDTNLGKQFHCTHL